MAANKQIRIIGGDWRGRKLATLDLPELKPTPDRVRETLFNWLMPDIHDAVCLDAFAGSGALGFEALSRGAKHVTFCEKSLKLCEQLHIHCEKLSCTERCTILNTDTFKTQFTQPFDIIFLDPPFHKNFLDNSIENLREIITPSTLIYAETEASYVLPNNLKKLKHKKAGHVSYYLVQMS